MEEEYDELEIKAFQQFLKDNEELTLEDLKCAYIKCASFLRFTSSYEGEIKKLNSIEQWTFLRELEIDINSIENLDGLEELPKLEKLFIRNVDNSKLKAIGKCKNLKVLQINGDINDISFLKDLNNLEDLGLQENENLTDISLLTNMRSLKELDLIKTGVYDISILNNLEKLEKIILNDTNVEDVSALAELPNLNSIFLANTKVKDISMLADLPKLEMLNVYNTDVEDVSAFIKKGKLNIIGIEKKKIPKPEKKDVQKEIAKLKEKIFESAIKLNEAAKESDIVNFETEYNIKFPENYRSFITQIGNGLTMFDEDGNVQASFNPLATCEFDKKGISKNFRYKDAWIWEEDETATNRKINNALSNGSICLSDTGCGTEYHLIINGPSRGQIWMFTGEGVVPFDTCSDFLDWVNEIIEGKIE